jgi:hypothetical protein
LLKVFEGVRFATEPCGLLAVLAVEDQCHDRKV